jgi:hypothetical protein
MFCARAEVPKSRLRPVNTANRISHRFMNVSGPAYESTIYINASSGTIMRRTLGLPPSATASNRVRIIAGRGPPMWCLWKQKFRELGYILA